MRICKWGYRDLPNALTWLRIVLVPVFVILLIEPTESGRLWAAVVFAVASLTDAVDGYLARRWEVVSDFGKLMDPLADKILVMAALVMLVSIRSTEDAYSIVPGWLVVLVLAREIWITGLRGLAAERGVVVAASWAGKIKSILQMVAIPLLLIAEKEFECFGRLVSFQFIGLQLLLFSVVVSYWGAFEYTLEIFSPRKEIKQLKQ